MYDLAPARTGRRGRPAKHGKRLSVETDFTFSDEKIGDYYTGPVGFSADFLRLAGKAPLNQTGSDQMQYIPLFLYSFRWNIETSYYEQKTFWSFLHYF